MGLPRSRGLVGRDAHAVGPTGMGRGGDDRARGALRPRIARGAPRRRHAPLQRRLGGQRDGDSQRRRPPKRDVHTPKSEMDAFRGDRRRGQEHRSFGDRGLPGPGRTDSVCGVGRPLDRDHTRTLVLLHPRGTPDGHGGGARLHPQQESGRRRLQLQLPRHPRIHAGQRLDDRRTQHHARRGRRRPDAGHVRMEIAFQT